MRFVLFTLALGCGGSCLSWASGSNLNPRCRADLSAAAAVQPYPRVRLVLSLGSRDRTPEKLAGAIASLHVWSRSFGTVIPFEIGETAEGDIDVSTDLGTTGKLICDIHHRLFSWSDGSLEIRLAPDPKCDAGERDSVQISGGRELKALQLSNPALLGTRKAVGFRFVIPFHRTARSAILSSEAMLEVVNWIKRLNEVRSEIVAELVEQKEKGRTTLSLDNLSTPINIIDFTATVSDALKILKYWKGKTPLEIYLLVPKDHLRW